MQRFKGSFTFFHVFLPFLFYLYFFNQSGCISIKNAGDLISLITWKTICALLWWAPALANLASPPFFQSSPLPIPYHLAMGLLLSKSRAERWSSRQKSSPPNCALIPWGWSNIRGPFDISPLLATNQELHLGRSLLWLKELFPPPWRLWQLYLPFADWT